MERLKQAIEVMKENHFTEINMEFLEDLIFQLEHSDEEPAEIIDNYYCGIDKFYE